MDKKTAEGKRGCKKAETEPELGARIDTFISRAHVQ